MKRAVVIGTVAAVLMSVGLAAQGRNFAGTWTIDPDKTMAAGGRGGGGGGARSGGGDVTSGVVAVAGARGGGGAGGGARSGGAGAPGMSLAIDATTFTVTQGQTVTAYKLDGSVIDVSNANRKASAKASWQGDKIAIETTVDGPNGPIVTHATWYLEGDSLVRENKSAGADGQEVVRKTYYKRS